MKTKLHIFGIIIVFVTILSYGCAGYYQVVSPFAEGVGAFSSATSDLFKEGWISHQHSEQLFSLSDHANPPRIVRLQVDLRERTIPPSKRLTAIIFDLQNPSRNELEKIAEFLKRYELSGWDVKPEFGFHKVNIEVPKLDKPWEFMNKSSSGDNGFILETVPGWTPRIYIFGPNAKKLFDHTHKHLGLTLSGASRQTYHDAFGVFPD